MIGIIGGAGPLASALLYRLIVEEYYVRQEDQPEIVILNHSFPRGLTCEESNQNEKRLEEELQACIRFLVQAGASRVCIACNTLHGFLKPPVAREVIHLPKKVISSLRRQKKQQVAVLCTETTCQSSLYQDEHIVFHYPSKKEQKRLNSVLDRILEGEILQDDSVLVTELMSRMKNERGIDGVVLGCTDLSVLNDRFPFHSSEVAIFDSLKILAKEL